jgi:flagellar motor switch protein FliN/FliY
LSVDVVDAKPEAAPPFSETPSRGTGGGGNPVPASTAYTTPPLSDFAGAVPGGMGAVSPFLQTPEFLLDVRISVSVEVGRIQMSLRQVMALGPGSVIELQQSASEPVGIFANGRCIGRGEIVVVGDQFGVRITELGAE